MGLDFNIKKGIGIIIPFLLSFSLFGQRPLELIPVFNMPFPTEAGDLYEQYENYTLTVINHTDQPQTIYFLADFFGDNGVAITMDRFYQPMEGFQLGPNGLAVLTAADIELLNADLTEDQVFFEGVSREQLLFGSIPEGNYTLCINAFDFDTGEILSVGCTMPVYIGNANIPRIITPFEDEVIPATEMPVFNISWEFPGNIASQVMDLHYEVKLVNITENYDWDIEELFGDAGIPVHLETVVEGMNFYLYNNFGDDPELTYGHEYGIRVRAFDPTDMNYFSNGGYTEIRRFWYGEAGGVFTDSTDADGNITQVDSLPSDCEGRCNPAVPQNNTPVTDLSQVSSIRIGHFYLENYTLTASGAAFNGEAEITLNFLSDIKIKVDVSGLKINSAGEAFEGSVRSRLAQEESIQGMADYLRIPDALDPALDLIPEEEAASIANILEFVRTVDGLLGSDAVGLPIGFPTAVEGNEFYLGLTDLELSPTGARAKVMMSAKMAMFDGENPLLLVGDSVCIHPQGFGGQYTFGLKNDLQITSENDNNFELFLTGENTSSDHFCSVEMGCDGVEALNFYGHLEFPRSVLTPVVENMDALPPDQKVKALFGFTLNNQGNTEGDTTEQTSHLNWLAQVTMDKFEITGLKGWQFEIQAAYIDMSDVTNAPNANFPEDYHTTGPDFRGFYLKEASLTPPAHLITDSTSVLISDLLIDPALYGLIEAAYVLPLEKGSLAGFGFGIDSLNLHFYDNELVSGRMKGPMQIPITDITDSLYYFALIESTSLPGEEASYMYVFDVSLQDDVSFPFLVAEAEIHDDSYLDVVFIPDNDNEVYVQTVLHGVLNINTEEFYPENLPDLPAEARMFGLEFSLDYTSGLGFDSENSYIGFASPQKGLGGFPINIDNFQVGLAEGFESVAVQFDVDISFAEGEMDLGAGVTFTLISNLQTLDALGNIVQDGGQGALNTVKSFKLERIQFDSIFIEVDKGSFGFYGMIAFYNNPLEGGGRDKGVHGEVTVQLPVVMVNLHVIFGNIGTPPEVPEGQPIVYSEDFYTYWYVSGLVVLTTGIPICSGVGLYGLGGGVGYNTIQTSSAQIVDGEIVGDPVFTPTWNSFRLEFTVIFGTHPKPDAFNADVTFIAQFVNGGLDMIGIEGDGYVMTPINERMDPQVYMGVGIYLYTANEERDWYIDGYMRVAVNVNDGKFKGTMQNPVVDNQMVNAVFYVSEDTWYFYAGEPDMNPYDNEDPRGSAEFRINDNLTADFKAYMMVGHGVPLSLPPLPADIQRILNNPGGDLANTESVNNVGSGVSGNEAETGAGFAHGSYGSLRAEIDAKLVYASLAVYVGYDMNLTQRPYNCANTGGRIGINGWYAEGQAYAGIEGNLGIQVKLFGNEPTKFHVMDLAAAIALYGGAPAPAYFGGQATVYYSLLGGKLSGSETFRFSVGERCAIVPNDPFAGINFFEHVDPAHGDTDIPPYARALCKFTLPMDETIIIPVPVEDANGEVIDVEELGYTPRVFYELNRDFTNDKSSVSAHMNWLNDDVHDAFVVRPYEMFQQNRWYKLKITVKAIDEQTHGWLQVNGKDWTQDTIIRFRTGPFPDDLYEMVQYAIPMPYERFYLQDENTHGKIFFTMALDRDFYFPATNPSGIGDLSYYIRFTNLHDQTEVEVPFVNNCTGFGPHLRFNVPELENETIYALQVIRKNTGPVLRPGGKGGERNTGVISIVNTETATMDLTTTVLPPGELLDNNEFLLYHTYFRTSKYDDMAAKIGDAVMNNTTLIGNHPDFGKKARVNFQLEEKFEKRDFQSFYPNITYSEGLEFSPRVKMTDIFNKTYHDAAEDRLWEFKRYYTEVVQGGIFFLPFPSDLHINWKNYSNYTLSSSQLSGPLDDPLSPDEIVELWANYLESGSFVYSEPSYEFTGTTSSGGLIIGSITTSPAYNLTYNTHFRVGQDKMTMVDWANNYMSLPAPGTFQPYQNLFQAQYPQFITKKNRVANRNFKLENNAMEYDVFFNRNNSHVPGGESWSWFINEISFTSGPALSATGGTMMVSNLNAGSLGTTIFLGL